jgi:hypothetical protein
MQGLSNFLGLLASRLPAVARLAQRLPISQVVPAATLSNGHDVVRVGFLVA